MTETSPQSGNKQRKMRSASRLYAVQALFQMEQSNQTVDAVRLEFLDHRFGAKYNGNQLEDGDVDLFSKILEDAVNHQARIDQLTEGPLSLNGHWDALTQRCGRFFERRGQSSLIQAQPPKS